MFSFFGAFADRHSGIAEQFRQHWPDADIVEIGHPFCGIAVRFHESVYVPEEEDLPQTVSAQVQEMSRNNPAVRIVLLRTECWGGDCSNWGQFIRNGQVIDEPPVGVKGGKGVLRRLISNLDVDIGESEIFEPLSRCFPWGTQ